MKKVNVYLADGFEEIEAVTVIDVLRRAEVEVKTVSVSDNKEVTGAHGITVKADALLGAFDNAEADMLMLPGGMPGTKNLENSRELKEVIKTFMENGKYVAAICAAPSILGKMGLLNGVKAVCFPGFEQYLSGAKLGSDIVVQDGNIITSKGPGTAIYFALKLVELLKGNEAAEELRKGMIVQGD